MSANGDFGGDQGIDFAINTVWFFFNVDSEETRCLVTLFRNLGDGTFTLPETLLDLDSFSSQALLAEDFNGDGIAELIAGGSSFRKMVKRRLGLSD